MAHVSDELAPAAAEALPAVHWRHVELLVASSTSEYVPAMQAVQLVLPCKEYVPAGHMVHVSDEFAATMAEALPAVHRMHVALLSASSASE
jgi:hypothetical protein